MLMRCFLFFSFSAFVTPKKHFLTIFEHRRQKFMIVINFQQLQGSKIVCWQWKNQNRKSQAQKNGQSCLKGQDMAEQWERFWRIAVTEWKNVNEYLWPFVIGLEGCRDEIFALLHAWLLPRIVNFRATHEKSKRQWFCAKELWVMEKISESNRFKRWRSFNDFMCFKQILTTMEKWFETVKTFINFFKSALIKLNQLEIFWIDLNRLNQFEKVIEPSEADLNLFKLLKIFEPV